MTTKDDQLRRIYLVIPGSDLARRLVGDLHERSIPSQGMALFAYRPGRLSSLPVSVSGLGAGTQSALARGLVFGAAASSVGLALLAAGVHWVVIPVLALAGVAVGAGVARQALLPADAETLREEMGRDDVLMLVDVSDDMHAQIQKRIAEHYPEVRLKGIDPAGTPPFP